jgi:hypothetical protein
MGIFGAHLSNKFRLIRDVVVFLISIYTLYNISNFYVKGYFDGLKYGARLNSPVQISKETICYQTPNCTLYCNEMKYEFENSSFVIKDVRRYCLNDLKYKKFLLIGE